MIFSSAADDIITEDDTAGEAAAAAPEVPGPPEGDAVLGSVIVGAGAAVVAGIEVSGVPAALPLPPVEVQPVNSTAAAATQTHIDG